MQEKKERDIRKEPVFGVKSLQNRREIFIMKKYALVPIEQWDSEMKVIVEEPSSCAAASGNISFDDYSKQEIEPEEVIENRLQSKDRLEQNDPADETFADEALPPKVGRDPSLLKPEPENESTSLQDLLPTKQTNTSEISEPVNKSIKPIKKRETNPISPFNADAHNKKKKISTEAETLGKKKKKSKKDTETREASELQQKEVKSKSEKGRRSDRIRKPSKIKLESIESEKLWIA